MSTRIIHTSAYRSPPGIAPWLGAALLLLGGCEAVTVRRSTEQIIPVAKGTELQVTTTSGWITVEAGQPGHVRLRTQRKVRAVWGAQDKLKKIKVAVRKEGRVLHIRATHPGGRLSKSFRAGMNLVVPPDTKLTLKTGHGDLRLVRITGDVHGTTGQGELIAQGVTGRVTLRSGGGNVTLDGQPTGFDLQTKLGQVKLTLLAGTRLAHASKATTDDGSISLRASPKLVATVTASSRKGRLRSDWPVAARHPTWIRAELGHAGPELELATRRGSVRLEKTTSWRGNLDAPGGR